MEDITVMDVKFLVGGSSLFLCMHVITDALWQLYYKISGAIVHF